MDAAACIGCGACVAACKNASAMLRLSEALEENDDVQNVYSTLEISDAAFAAMEAE